MPTSPRRVDIVGRGRLGTALARAFTDAGLKVGGPHSRGYDGADAEIVVLCVPDREISAAAQAISPKPGLLVGHTSGATTLDALGPHEAFSLHPLMTIPRSGADFTGATAAVAGTTESALQVASELAEVIGMVAAAVDERERGTYHAAGCVASNYLMTVLDFADRLAAQVGITREQLAPIVRASVDNWVRDGGEIALTGPVLRGDEATLDRHRAAIADHLPADAELHEALIEATRELAARAHQRED
ncbi:DUF2520 domain-containing protein [Epidermidibacterium keratini]|uniref:DUF2520 domain-containing protein n=1 Tax=Epidermidibacterium keratini TaxID=1891644 RepID=A0A7L4YRL2_9ACTN|nr:Rossmann-like and DUF2520 domain-containing protein [Epidermidibacterium keratini]QHC01207.1 DUF2520 domain-containing protein [Epidermidibacterium keratini]